MSRVFCKVCGNVFEASALTDGACDTCLEVKSRPHVSHDVFRADDLDFHGRSKGWFPLLGGLLVIVAAGIFFWDTGVPARDPSALDEITLEVLFDEADPDWIQELEERLLTDVSEASAALRQRATSLGRTAWIDRTGGAPERVGRYDLTIRWEGGDPWIVARPRPPLLRHLLIAPDGRTFVSEEGPATVDDPLLSLPPLSR